MLPQEQPLTHHQLLLVDRHDQHTILLPGGDAFIDHLANRYVLDFYLFAVSLDLETGGHLLNLGLNPSLTNLAQLFTRHELLFFELDGLLRVGRIGPLPFGLPRVIGLGRPDAIEIGVVEAPGLLVEERARSAGFWMAIVFDLVSGTGQLDGAFAVHVLNQADRHQDRSAAPATGHTQIVWIAGAVLLDAIDRAEVAIKTLNRRAGTDLESNGVGHAAPPPREMSLSSQAGLRAISVPAATGTQRQNDRRPRRSVAPYGSSFAARAWSRRR